MKQNRLNGFFNTTVSDTMRPETPEIPEKKHMEIQHEDLEQSWTEHQFLAPLWDVRSWMEDPVPVGFGFRGRNDGR